MMVKYMKIFSNIGIKEVLLKINYQFNKKKYLLIFLLLLLGVLLPTLSGTKSYNFWNRLYNILNNPVYNMMLFISVGINLIYLAGDMKSNYMIISRYGDLKLINKKFIEDIIIFTVYLIFISFILAIASSVLFSFGDIKMINHPLYDIPMVIYILFFFLRSIILASIVNSIIFLVYTLFNKIITIIIVLINSSYFMINNVSSSSIAHFYNMHLLFHNYYTYVNYNSFFLEIIISIMEIIIMFIINNIIFNIAVRKKSDLL